MLPNYLIISVLLVTAAVITTADVFDQMDEFWHNMDQQFEKLDNEMDKIFENSNWDQPPFQAAEQGNVYQVIMRLDGISEREIKVNTYGNVVVINALHNEPDMRRQFHHTQIIPEGYKTTGRWKYNARRHVLTLMFDKAESTNVNSGTGGYHNTRYAGTNSNRQQPPNRNQNTNIPGQFHSTDNSHVSPSGPVGTQNNIHQTEQEQTGSGSSTIPHGRVPIDSGSTSVTSYPQRHGNSQNKPSSWQSTGYSTGSQGGQFGTGQATSVNNDSPTEEPNSNIGAGRPSGGHSTIAGSGYGSRGQGSNYGAGHSPQGQGYNYGTVNPSRQVSNNGAGHSSQGQGFNYGPVNPARGQDSNNGAGHSPQGQGYNYGTVNPSRQVSNNGAGHSSQGQGFNYGPVNPARGQGSNNGAGNSPQGQGSNYGTVNPAREQGSNNGAGHSPQGQGSNYRTVNPARGQVSNNGAGHSSQGQGFNYGAVNPARGQGSNNGAGHSSQGQGSNYEVTYPAAGQGSNNGVGHSTGGHTSNNGAGFSSAGQAQQPSSNVNGVTEQPGVQGENVTPDVYRTSSHQRSAGGGYVQGDPNTFRQWETGKSSSQARYHIDSDGQVIPLGQEQTPDGIRVHESRQQFQSVSETHTVGRNPGLPGSGNAGSSTSEPGGDNPPQHNSSGRLRNGKIYNQQSDNGQNQKY